MPRTSPGLDPFYLIVPDAASVGRFAALGVRTIQLRAKDLSSRDARREIVAAMDAAMPHADCQLIVNDYWREALSVGCDYIHLGQEDLVDADIATLKCAGVRIGVSTHDAAELAVGLAIEPDYVALGPINPTTTKATGRAAQGLATVTDWRHRIGPSMPLVAIGGIGFDQAAGIVAAGADSCCVVSDVLSAADPAVRTRQWLAWAATVRRRT
jgi:thiamine-phosphate pyrophosphorylase